MLKHGDERSNDEYDVPWKGIVESYFKDFIAFFLPSAHAGIDWRRGYEFLDTELARITRESKVGDRRMDKLVKVWRRDGIEYWVLIHVEVQGDRKRDFASGMYVYQYRAYDLYRKPVCGLAILADQEVNWRPSEFRYAIWGTKQRYQFTSIKLLDYAQAELKKSDNLFAIVTLAHLQAKKTRNLAEDRYLAKINLVRSLYRRGFDRQKIIDLFLFIDWVLHLPEDADKRFWKDISDFEETKKMPYISSVERIGQQIGEQRGERIGQRIGEKRGRKKEAAAILLEMIGYKFGQVAESVTEKVAGADRKIIRKWHKNLIFANSLDDVFAL
ncbi:MAG: hypothetical protein H7839_18050 [Magnetococcus sp. YQC-5]